MPSLFRLNQGDFLRGLVVAVLAAVFTQLAAVANTPGFDIMLFDWTETLKIAVAAAVGYVSKNFLTDSEGKIFGKF